MCRIWTRSATLRFMPFWEESLREFSSVLRNATIVIMLAEKESLTGNKCGFYLSVQFAGVSFSCTRPSGTCCVRQPCQPRCPLIPLTRVFRGGKWPDQSDSTTAFTPVGLRRPLKSSPMGPRAEPPASIHQRPCAYPLLLPGQNPK